jgi:hypothetical protein
MSRLSFLFLPARGERRRSKKWGWGQTDAPPVSFQKFADCDGNSTLLGSK